MAININTDVLIVGAGPTGLTLACTLARYGVDILIIDKNSERSSIPKASIMNARSMEILDDIGAIDFVLDIGMRINNLLIYAEGKKLALSNYNTIDSKFNFALNIGQPHTEKALEDRLNNLGCEVKRNCELIEMHQIDSTIEATLRDDQSDELNIKCRFLVGCDGARSFVRHKLNLEFEGKEYRMDNITGEVDIDWDFPKDQHLFAFNRDGAFALSSMPENRWLVWANMPMLEKDKSRYYEGMEPAMEELQGYFDERCPFKAKLSNVGWLTYYVTHERGVKNLRHGNIFLAGDAAHISSPASGQGMNTGIQDAHNLGYKLAFYLLGRGTEDLLDSYESERKVFMKARKAASDVNELIFGLQGHFAQHVRNLALRFISSIDALNAKSTNQTYQLSMGYRKSNVVDQFAGLPIHLLGAKHLSEEHICADAWLHFGSGPHAGDRMRDCYCLSDKKGSVVSLDSQFGDGKCHLLFFIAANNPSSELISEVNSICDWVDNGHADWMEFHIVVPGEMTIDGFHDNANILFDTNNEAHSRYGAKGECIYFIRPDGYIGYRSLPPNLQRLQKHLKTVYGVN